MAQLRKGYVMPEKTNTVYENFKDWLHKKGGRRHREFTEKGPYNAIIELWLFHGTILLIHLYGDDGGFDVYLPDNTNSLEEVKELLLHS